MSDKALSVLCLGDVVARPGRSALQLGLPELRKKYEPDLLIVNGENASGGTGLDAKTAAELREMSIDVITLGDHTWKYKDLRPLLDKESWCVRPHNYPGGAGKGWTILPKQKDRVVGVLNLMGRTFMNASLDCPFQTAEHLLTHELSECDVVICDFHAEATSEKIAFARHFDSRICLLFGTHTHVGTADAQILPGGMGYVSDLGMCGSHAGVIGMDAGTAVARFRTGLPSAYRPSSGQRILNGIYAEIDLERSATTLIDRVQHLIPE